MPVTYSSIWKTSIPNSSFTYHKSISNTNTKYRTAAGLIYSLLKCLFTYLLHHLLTTRPTTLRQITWLFVVQFSLRAYSAYLLIYLLNITEWPSPRYYRVPRYFFTVHTVAQYLWYRQTLVHLHQNWAHCSPYHFATLLTYIFSYSKHSCSSNVMWQNDKCNCRVISEVFSRWLIY